MKKYLFILFLSALIANSFAQDLLFIPTNNNAELYANNTNIKIHLYGDDFIIASGATKSIETATILDSKPWTDNDVYSIFYVDKQNKESYLSKLSDQTKICLDYKDFVILKHAEEEALPAKNDASIRITKNEAKLAEPNVEIYSQYNYLESDPFIELIISEIDIDAIEANIQHMEDYGTRYYNKPEAFQSEQWIKEQFEALGLETEIHTFPQNGSSGNVIAIQTGTVYPDEYVVCGAHYDTYNNNHNFNDAPGADDNATGVASIIEAARILSQYEMERSIVYCAWAAEEIGLIGSQYYAEDAAAEGMDIIGYFNLDMTGYLDPSQEFEFVLHYSHNSELLRDFYINVANAYYPGVPVNMSFSSWGSDYASFANNGYMGVSQNEDWSHANPHYHSPTDLIGPSVNNFEQVETYAGLNLASVATLANSLMAIPFPPQNLVGEKGDQSAMLNWDVINADIIQYNLYRDEELIANIEPTENSYLDTNLENETTYTYYLTAMYEGNIESSPSNEFEITPLSPISYPFFTDFEDAKAFYWSFSEGWGLASNASHSPSHSLSDSPSGLYDNNNISHCELDPISLTGGGFHTYMEFYTMHLLSNIGEGDFVYLEIKEQSSNDWIILESFAGTQSQWILKQYDLDAYQDQTINIRFRMTTDNSNQEFGFFMDDFKIDYSTQLINSHKNSIKVFPNPSSDVITVKYPSIFTELRVINTIGQQVIFKEINENETNINISSLNNGIYFLQIISKNQEPYIFKFTKE